MGEEWAHLLAWNAIGYGIVAALCVVILAVLFLTVPYLRRRWLPFSRLRPGDWKGYDVFGAFIVMILAPVLSIWLLSEVGFFDVVLGPEPPAGAAVEAKRIYAIRCGNLSSPLTATATLGALLAFLYVRSCARPHHYGLSWGRWQANVALGAAAFVVVTPIVLGVFALITLFVSDIPHPLTQIAKNGLEWFEWALIAFQAVIAAPLVEEVFHRGILLGWLRRATLGGHLVLGAMSIVLVGMTVAQFNPQPSLLDYLNPILFVILLVAGYGVMLYRTARQFHLSKEELREWRVAPAPWPEEFVRLAAADEASDAVISIDEAREMRLRWREANEARVREWAEANADLAVLGSSIFFAALHSQAWPAPVPLVILALVLGWMARRTQSLIGPIVLHALFNLCSYIALFGSV